MPYCWRNMVSKAQVKGPEHQIYVIFITNEVQHGIINIKYCLIDNMIGDNMRKGLQAIKFNKVCNEIIGF